METLLKFCEVLKCYVQDCPRIFPSLSIFTIMIGFSIKSPIIAQRRCSILKTTTDKKWKLLDDSFWTKETWEIMFTKNVSTRTFPLLPTFILILKTLERLWIYQKHQIIEIWRILRQVINKNLFSQTFCEFFFCSKD